MPYASWSQVAEAVEGEARLKSLHPSLKSETVDSHPFFDSKMALVDQIIDAAAAEAGYETPLQEPLTDPRIAEVATWLFVDKVSLSKDQRADWMDRFAREARAFLVALQAGEITLRGAEIDETPDLADRGALFVSDPEPAMFDTANPYSEINRVMPPLAPPSGWSRRWR